MLGGFNLLRNNFRHILRSSSCLYWHIFIWLLIQNLWNMEYKINTLIFGTHSQTKSVKLFFIITLDLSIKLFTKPDYQHFALCILIFAIFSFRLQIWHNLKMPILNLFILNIYFCYIIVKKNNQTGSKYKCVLTILVLILVLHFFFKINF